MSLVVSLVLSRPDYGNATLAGLPDNQLDRLQSVMNAAARLVCSARKYTSTSPRYSVTFTGCGCQRGQSLNSPCSSFDTFMVRLHRTSRTSYDVLRTWTRERGCDLRQRPACHAIIVSYDVFRRWTARLEHCHPASLRLTLSTSKRRLNASFCHVIILTFFIRFHVIFFAVSFVKCS